MKTFVIADCSINHAGNFLRARHMIKAAKECGCSAVSFQTYTEDTIIKSEDCDEMKRYEIKFEQQKELKKYADEIGIEFISAPRDEQALSFLAEGIGVRKIKILSQDTSKDVLLRRINDYATKYYNFECIMETRGKRAYDINNALSYLPDVALLTLEHCSNEYNTNLLAIKTLSHMVHGHRQVGYADYTQGILSAASSVLVGAKIVEKSFIINTRDRGNDIISATPDMITEMIGMIKVYEQMLGNEEIVGGKDEQMD